MIESLPSHVYWEQRLHRIVTKAVSTTTPNTSTIDDNTQNNELRLLIDVSDNEGPELSSQMPYNLGILSLF